ncbi:MAG: hypothetical protein WD716_00205 [Fimbriimonadaceae bacterium]
MARRYGNVMTTTVSDRRPVRALPTIPTVLLFFFAQRHVIEGVHLSGLGGK